MPILFPIDFPVVIEAARKQGKVVVLKTVSGEEIVGKVVKVKNGIVVLKLFKATIYVAINKIIAVVIR